MPEELPSWFAAQETHRDHDGWYIGSRDGIRVGPYALQAQAEERSRSLVARLATCADTGERVRVVRQFLGEQKQEPGRLLRSGPPVRAPAPSAQAPAPQAPTGDPDDPAVRAGEAPRVWFRTNRCFSVGGSWFFATREGVNVGPYATRQEAERDAERLMEALRDIPAPAEARLHILQFQSRPSAS